MVAFVTAAAVTIWFLVGGMRDLFRMFRLLNAARPDARDDGRVEDHRNADEIPARGSGKPDP